jgi:hypothetical protein
VVPVPATLSVTVVTTVSGLVPYLQVKHPRLEDPMTDVTDLLAAQLDAESAPPAPLAIDDLLRDGRRARTRRRLTVGAGAVAAALVIGGTAWTLAAGDSDVATDPPPIAGQTTPTAAPVLEGGELAGYGPDGELVIRTGWHVTQRIPNPMGSRAPEESVALELTDGTKTYWYLLHRDSDGYGATSDPAQKGYATFQEWVDDQVGANQPDPIGQALDLGPDGRLTSSDDAVRIVDQRVGVDIGLDGWAPEDTTVAELRLDGVRWFVAARNHVRGGWELAPPIDTPKAGTTLDSYVDYLRAQYASGEGVR